MPDMEAARLGVYDHESDASLGRVRRAPDWGGDDLFTSMPVRRRRFAAPSRARREDPGHAAPRERRRAPVSAFAASEADFAAAAEAFGPAAADFQPVNEGPAPVEAIAPPVELVEPVQEPAAAERRTVHVTGRPDEAPAFAAPHRRPSRALHERVGARPDRVAGWACGLGALLILVAVSTADAAPL